MTTETPILSQLTEVSLQNISNQRQLTFEKRRPSKQSMLSALSADITTQGTKAFSQVLSVTELKTLTAKLSKSVLSANGANNKNSKTVLSKRLYEEMQKAGVVEYLEKQQAGSEALTGILSHLGAEATSKKTADLIKQLETEIQYLGLSALFANCSVKQLQGCVKDLGLTVESSAKTVLLRCILENRSYTAEDKPKIVRKPKEKKDKENQDKENVDADGDHGMEDAILSEIPRAAPPKFDWEASEDDGVDFVADEQEEEDVDMSDASENEDEDEEDEDEEQSGEYEETGELDLDLPERRLRSFKADKNE